MNKKKIILFSCRDPACGFNVRNFILNSDLLKEEVIDFKIICQEPCSYVFKNNYMINNSKIRFIPTIKRKKTLLNEATSIIEEFYPDILISHSSDTLNKLKKDFDEKGCNAKKY